MWVLKKLVVHFGLKGFAERTLISWWAVLEKLGREREGALLPGPIKGLALFLLRVDTKVTSLTDFQLPLVQALSSFPLSLVSHILIQAHTRFLFPRYVFLVFIEYIHHCPH